MRVSSGDLRPSWLPYMGYIASVSKVLQSVEETGNSQLTIDEAIYFDQGTRIALLMFNNEGERRLPEPSEDECEAIRLEALGSNRSSLRYHQPREPDTQLF